MTAQCHTVHGVSPHQAERERDGDGGEGGREGEKVAVESEGKKQERAICPKFSARACMSARICLACMRACSAEAVWDGPPSLEGSGSRLRTVLGGSRVCSITPAV